MVDLITQKHAFVACLFFVVLANVHSKSEPFQPYRTGYHFQPAKNWMNDPNGPFIYNGIYHLFYQYNPKGAEWGNIVWAHSTSIDLVNWKPHVAAIYPTKPFDINGCWSGSVTILPGGRPVIFYTGVDSKKLQVQNIAYPKNLSDPFLREWVKIPQNPLISPTLANQINATAFRDPTTAWLGPDKHWRLVIGSLRNERGVAYQFRSKDFLYWVKAKHPLYSHKKDDMWECPDFFPVLKDSSIGVDTSTYGPKVKHVFKVSINDTRKEYYLIGTYDLKKDVFIPDDEGSVERDSVLRYDYGKFYASKTFFDSAKNRRILWGWINESSLQIYDNKGWSGLMAIPRTIVLDRTGRQLLQWPIIELEKLRMKEVKLSTVLNGGSLYEVLGVTAAQADVDISFEITDLKKAQVLDAHWSTANPQTLCSSIAGSSVKRDLGPFGLMLLASEGLNEYTAVYYHIFKSYQNHKKYGVLMCSDQSRSSLNPHDDKETYGAFVNVNPLHQKLSLRSLIDHSIVESFGGGGEACITARVYPTLAVEDDAHLFIFNHGREGVKIVGSAWSMKTAQIN